MKAFFDALFAILDVISLLYDLHQDHEILHTSIFKIRIVIAAVEIVTILF